jgi:cytochrome c oxidase subunit 1
MALVVDNTTWEAGMLHLTLGTAAALTFMGITYWLIPYLTQRRLVSRGLATLQAWLWFFGVLIFSRGMGIAGLIGAPRRTPFSLSSFTQTLAGAPEIGPGGSFQISMILVAVGGLIMALSGLFYLLNIAGTLVGKKDTAVVYDVPLADALDSAEPAPASLDRWRLWVGVAVVLILVAYVPTILNVLQVSGWNTPGFVIH